MAQLEVSDFAQAVIDRMADCKDARFKQIMSSLVKHAHAFAREVDLTPEEWMAGIQFLTAVGQKCDDKRQEFILLSDTLGVSMLVVGINNKKPPGATQATVFGPFVLAPSGEADGQGAGVPEEARTER